MRMIQFRVEGVDGTAVEAIVEISGDNMNYFKHFVSEFAFSDVLVAI